MWQLTFPVHQRAAHMPGDNRILDDSEAGDPDINRALGLCGMIALSAERFRCVLPRVQGACWDLVPLHDLFGRLLTCLVPGRCSHCERSGRSCTSQRYRSGPACLSETETKDG